MRLVSGRVPWGRERGRGSARARGRAETIRLALALALTVATANADTARPEIDWAAGLVTATGLGVADRHAPSPAAARDPARHAATEAARKQLAARIPTIPLAGGGKLGDKLSDAAIKTRVDRVLASAPIVVDATPDTDGSYRVTLGLPLEALRQAVLAGGPRTLGGDADSAPPVVVVDNVPAATRPALGWTIDGVAAPTLWVRAVPAWAKDAPHIKATSASSGAIRTGGARPSDATLFLIVTR